MIRIIVMIVVLAIGIYIGMNWDDISAQFKNESADVVEDVKEQAGDAVKDIVDQIKQ